MPTKATNQKKRIITNSVRWKQLAKSKKPLPYHLKGDSGSLPTSDNTIETFKASSTETCTHTRIGLDLVVHHETKIGHPTSKWPSWYKAPGEALGAPPNGKGIVGKQVQYFAQARKGSPDLMVEGKWAEREGDPTHQDNANGDGSFIYADGEAPVPDDSDLIFAQCGVSSLKLACSHGREVLVDPQSGTNGNILEVFIGDVVTITATRVNLADTNPTTRHVTRCDFALYKEKRKPPPEEFKHAAFVLSRDMGIPVPGVTQGWSKRENVTTVGENSTAIDPTSKERTETSVIKLEEDWLLKGPEGAKKEKESKLGKKAAGKLGEIDKAGQQADRDLPRLDREKQEAYRADSKARQAVAQSRIETGSGGTKARDTGYRARQEQYDNQKRAEATGESLRQASQAKADAVTASGAGQLARVAKGVYDHVDEFKALLKFINFQSLNVTVNAHGCSKGPVGIIRAYPKGDVVCDLWKFKDFPFKDTVEVIKNCVTRIKQFLKYIKGSKVKGQGAPSEEGAAPDAGGAGGAVSAGYFTIGLVFFQRKVEKTQGQALATSTVSEKEVGPQLEVHAEWKELERDSDPAQKEKPGLKKWMVRRAWSLVVGVEKVLGLYFSADVPLLAMSFCAPLQRVLDFFGVKAGPYIKFAIALSFGFTATFTWTEYGALSPNLGSVPVEATIDLRLYVQLGDAAEVGIDVAGTWKPTYKIVNNPNGQACVDADESHIVIKCEVYAKVSLGIFGDHEYKKEIDTWDISIAKTSWPIIEAKN